jgi:hypothetical protein
MTLSVSEGLLSTHSSLLAFGDIHLPGVAYKYRPRENNIPAE